MRKLLTEQELEEHIAEISEWLKEEKDGWAKENLQANLKHFEKLLEYYNKGFDDGYRQSEEEHIDDASLATSEGGKDGLR